jgi:putative aminopeptidase FrvX
MRKESVDFLRELCETPSPSGFESGAQAVYRNYVKPYVDQVKTDVMGNVYAIANPKGKPSIMLAGHCDQIGFMVKYITDDGYIHFGFVGGVDGTVAAGQRVMIMTKKGLLPGVLGRKPIHLMEDEDRKKAPKADDMWIDLGMKSKAEVEKRVSLGDPGVLWQPFTELANGRVVSMAFDDKMGSWVVGEVMRLLAGKKMAACVYGVSTVQEEIGLRGARTSAYETNADLGIAIDVGFAMDHPGADKKKVGDLKMDGGPMICRGPNCNEKMFDLLVDAAKKNKIPYQIEIATGGTGTDANAMQLSRSGMVTGLISVPNRYMHTQNEMVSLKDLDNTAKLIAAFIQRLDPKMDWTP